MKKKKLNNNTIDRPSISNDSITLLENLKPPFESTDEYLNRLINIQNQYNEQKGKEFINMVFHEDFLTCTKEYLKNYESQKKKEKIVHSKREEIKQVIQELFNAQDDTILTLLLLVDESVTLLFQTKFHDFLSQYTANTDEFEDVSEEENFLTEIK